jgi:alpha-D-ribose 1-methylphosphonate 5-triphosphate synthase subunit PhnG
MMNMAAPAPARIGSEPDPVAARQRWLAVLARARLSELEDAWEALAEKPAYSLLRPTEAGLAMVRGRLGGTGQPFNLGEMTMTRAAVQLRYPDGRAATGFGYIAGRQARRAELVAIFDAMLQLADRHDLIAERVIAPLEARQSADKAGFAHKVAASKVEFFTVVRGS